MNQAFIMYLNGGNSYTEKAKEKIRKVFSCIGRDLTTDLHSMGQFIYRENGSRIMFENVLNVEKSAEELYSKEEAVDLDGLN